MRQNNYIAVISFQLELNLACNSKKEYLIVDDKYYTQMEKSIELLNELNPDIAIFPEMSFNEKYENIMLKISKDTLIVFGSTYIDGDNYTVIYQKGRRYNIMKKYPCPDEPMARHTSRILEREFLENYLEEHTFIVKGQKVIVLNCLEYYKVAYYISGQRNDVFGFLVPASSSNLDVFVQESMAIHNHNESIYSFICNTVSKYNGKDYGVGESYIFGPICKNERKWLKEEGVNSFNHLSSIAKINNKSEYIYGEFIISRFASKFKRSDFYESSPKNLIIKHIIRKDDSYERDVKR